MTARTAPASKAPLLTMAALLVAHVFLLTPLTLFSGNSEEFATPLPDLLQLLLIPVLVGLLLLLLPGVLLPPAARLRYPALLGILGLLCWMQATLLVWDYGLLDGRPIDWTRASWRGWLDGAIWVLAILLAAFLPPARRGLVYRVAGLVFVVHLAAAAYAVWEKRHQLPAPSPVADASSLEQAFRFSNQANVLHLVLDGFQADIFQELMEHPRVGAPYRALFDGFVFYNEALSAFPYTQFSVPSYLSGRVYDNRQPKDVFIDEALGGETVLDAAASQGFEVDLIIGSTYLANRFANSPHEHLVNIDTLGAVVEQTDALKLVDLALFRAAPHFVKPLVYNEQKWLLSGLLGGGKLGNLAYFRHTQFLNALTEGLTADRQAPTYKYLHVMTTHRPMVLGLDCAYAGRVLQDSRENLLLQSKCALDSVARLFLKLKELGIYDDMLIVMHADHGGWVANRRSAAPIVDAGGNELSPEIASLASPMLAIKVPGRKGRLRIEPALASLLDIPDTISDIMDWPATFGHASLLDIDTGEARTRRYYYYRWRQDEWDNRHTLPIQEFLIEGSHYEETWKPGRVFEPPAAAAR